MTAVAIATAFGLPELIDRASKALAGARTAAEVLDARDMASVAYDAAKKAARLYTARRAHDDLIAAAFRAQADAHEIEAQAKRRLADEYDAAQDRGEVVGPQGGGDTTVPVRNAATAADVGLSRKDIYEARQIRDAEKRDPGVVRRTLNEAVKAGREPTRAEVRRAISPSVAAPRRGKEAVRLRVRDALTNLSGLPAAGEVAQYFREEDEGILVRQRMHGALTWLQSFVEKMEWE